MTAPAVWLGRTFASLKIRDFRLLWLGSASEHTGEWMERIAVGWLVLQMTNSPFMVGLTEFMRFVALLIFPFIAGATADRVDRKKLLIATLLGLSGISAVMVVLVLTGSVTVAHLLTYSFLSGVFIAFNHPARATLLAGIVDRAHYPNAVSLDSLAVMSSRIIGSPLAGLYIAAYGVAGIMGVRFLACLLAVMWLLKLKAPPMPTESHKAGVWTSVTEGLRYVAADRAILGITVMSFVPMMFIFVYVSQLPVFARDVLNTGAGGLGFLNTSIGVGALIGLIWLASKGDYSHKGVLFFLSIIIPGLTLVAFSASQWLWLSIILLLIVGATNSIFTALRSTLVLLIVPDHLRGRVMSLRELSWGTTPLGMLLLGVMAEAWGAPTGTAILAGAGAAIGVIAMLSMARIRRLQ